MGVPGGVSASTGAVRHSGAVMPATETQVEATREPNPSTAARDAGSTLASVIVAMMLFSIFGGVAIQNYVRGATAIYQAHAHADAAGVLAWHISEFRDDPSACNGTSQTVTELVPHEKLTPPDGFTVACQPQAAIPRWPPAACGDLRLRTQPSRPASSLSAVTVEWNTRGAARSMSHTLIGARLDDPQPTAATTGVSSCQRRLPRSP